MTLQSDQELVLKIQQGDIFAFEVLVKRYQKRIINFAAGIMGDRYLAQEVAQDTFFSVYQTIDRVDRSRKFSTYLFAIAKNSAISKLRKTPNETLLGDEAVGQIDGAYLKEMSRQENKDRVRKAIVELSEKYRNIITLYYFADLSYQQISQKLKLPINTVRTHLRRAKENLRKILTVK